MKNRIYIDWDNGTYKENEQAFVDFTKCLNESGVNALFVIFDDSNYMSIYVNSIEDVKDAKTIIARQSQKIIDSFFATMAKYKIGLKYDKEEWKDYSLSSIYSFEISCVTNIVRKYKDDFIVELDRQIQPTPKCVFCHSAEDQNYSRLPGYNLVFEDKNDLKKMVPEIKDKIMVICDKILSRNDKTGFYHKSKIEIQYFDTVTNSKSLYGMSRED
jgi:hypothetical protein